MNLQISPVGLLIAMPVYALLLFLLYRFWKQQRMSKFRWSVVPLVPVVLVLPFADEFWIAWHFHEVCKDAGVHVGRTVTADGFFDDTSPWTPDLLNQSGYRFIEFNELGGSRIVRLEKRAGAIQKAFPAKPTSRYRYQFASPLREVVVGLQLEKRETQVIDTVTGEVLARRESFSRYPSFIERLWVRFLGSGQTFCLRPLDDYERKTPIEMPYRYSLAPSAESN